MKNRDLLKLIKKDGWRYSYSTGGHDHYIHPAKPGKVTFAVMPPTKLHRER